MRVVASPSQPNAKKFGLDKSGRIIHKASYILLHESEDGSVKIEVTNYNNGPAKGHSNIVINIDGVAVFCLLNVVTENITVDNHWHNLPSEKE